MKQKQTTSERQKQRSAACYREAKRKQKSAAPAFNPIALLSRTGETLSPQAKLEVSSPGDELEKEADSVADRVVQNGPARELTASGVQASLQRSAEDEAQTVQRTEEDEAQAVQRTEEDEAQTAQRTQQEDAQTSILRSEEDEAQTVLQRQDDDQAPQGKLYPSGDSESEETQTRLRAAARRSNFPVRRSNTVSARGPPRGPQQSPKTDEEQSATTALQRAIQRRETTAGFGGRRVEIVLAESKLAGRPLDPFTRGFMEERMAADFSNVRIHTDDRAAWMCRQLNARAFAHGGHVYFGRGQYDSQSRRGQHLIAHELTHTIQQGVATPHGQAAGQAAASAGIPGTQPEQQVDAASTLTCATALGHSRDTPPPGAAHKPDVAARQAPDAADSQETSQDVEELQTETAAPVLLRELQTLADADAGQSQHRWANRLPSSASGALARTRQSRFTVHAVRQSAIKRADGTDQEELQTAVGLRGPPGRAKPRQMTRAPPSRNGSVSARGPPTSRQQTISPTSLPSLLPAPANPSLIQGSLFGDTINEYANDVPGWRLLTVVVGYNPLTGRDVERTATNFLGGVMALMPGGSRLFDKLNEEGVVDEAFTWLRDRQREIGLTYSGLVRLAEEARDEILSIGFRSPLAIIRKKVDLVINMIKAFATALIDKVVELLRETLAPPLLTWVREQTRAYPLLTVIISNDPITGQEVPRTIPAIIEGFLMLTETGEDYWNKLQESGKLTEAITWLETTIRRYNLTADRIIGAFTRLWDDLSWRDVLDPIGTFRKIYDAFAGPVTDILGFVEAVALKVLRLIKDWLLGLLKEHANEIPGYPLLRVMLGSDPLTGEAVPRTAENFILGFLSFVPGGREKFQNLQESGAIEKAFAWLEEAVGQLGLIGEALMNAFTQIWETFSITDLTNPIAAFGRVIEIFTQPVRMIIDFAIEVGMKILEFIFEGVLGPTGARVLAILKRARSTFTTIIDDPIGFVGNLIEAVKRGFRQFAGNILQHLQAGLIGWLTGTLGSAGITLPERFDFRGILSLVMQVLGITWPRVRQKLVRRIGERAVSILETGFEVVRILVTEGPAGLWNRLVEHLSNLRDTVIDGIKNFIITRIVTAAVTRIATMLNPAGAVIQAIIAIYNTIMFFIERINQILDLVEAVVNSISNIAEGNLEQAANYVEQSMARTIPVIISFLARLIGLGNVSGAIQDILRRVQSAVDRAIDRVLDWIVRQARRLLSRIAGRGGGADAVDPNSLSPDQKKERARTQMEQFIRRGNVTGQQIRAQLPTIKRDNALSDVRLSFTGEGPRVEYYASDPYFTKLSGEGSGTEYTRDDQTAEFTGQSPRSGLTPYGVIRTVFGDNVNPNAFGNRTRNLAIPVSVVAEKSGAGSSAGRRSSSFVEGVGKAGEDEEQIAVGNKDVRYRGGHLIAWNVLGNASNQGFNVAPQVIQFNAPAYYHIFEKVNMNTAGRVKITVRVGYSCHSYQVDQDTLKANGVIGDRDSSKPWTVTIPKRIPNTWSAMVLALDGGTLAEGGVTSGTDTAGRDRVAVNPSEFDALNFNEVSSEDATHSKWHSFRMRIVRGGRREASGAIRTGGGRMLQVDGEQVDFTPSAPRPEPTDFQDSPQPKLEDRVNQPADAFEREADRLAAHVAGAGGNNTSRAPPISRISASLQRTPDAGDQSQQTLQHAPITSSNGNPMSRPVQREMESGFSANFSSVRIHTDSNAVQMNRGIQAKAFTHGNNIYFNQGQYNPDSTAGKHLLAHELTHTIQQGASPAGSRGIQRQEDVATAPAPATETFAPISFAPPDDRTQNASPLPEERELEADGNSAPSPLPASARKDKAPAGPVPDDAKKTPTKEEASAPPKAGAKKEKAALASGSGSRSDEDFLALTTSTATDIARQFPGFGKEIETKLAADARKTEAGVPVLVAENTGERPAEDKPKQPVVEGQEAQLTEDVPETGKPKPELKKHKNRGPPPDPAKNDSLLDRQKVSLFVSWFKSRFGGFLNSIATRDDGVNTNAGQRPKVKLNGKGNPDRARQNRSEGDRQAGAKKREVKSLIQNNKGEDRVQPVAVRQENKVLLAEAKSTVETKKQDDMQGYLDMDLPDNVRQGADRGMAPRLDKSLAKEREKVKQGAKKRDDDKQAEIQSTKEKTAELNRDAKKNQDQEIRSRRKEIASEKARGRQEADKLGEKFNTQADKEQNKTKKDIDKKVKEKEDEADRHLKAGERRAEAKKKEEEQKAAEKKRELNRAQKKKSWWDRVCDAIKSAVRALTNAIKFIFKALREAVATIINAAKELALAAIEAARKLVIGLLDAFGTFLKGLVNTFLKDQKKGLAKRINKFIDDKIDQAKAAVNDFADKLKKGVQALADALTKALNKILGVFETLLTAAVGIAGALLTGDFAEAFRIAVESACDIAGIDSKPVFDFFEKAGALIGKILRDPVAFIKNVAAAGKKGIDLFTTNIVKHLVTGVIDWLSGAMSDVPIQLPKKFDLKGIFSIVMQVLGLTYDRLKAKLIKELGPGSEKAIGAVEQGVSFLMEVKNDFPMALWGKMKEKWENIKEQAKSAIQGAIIKEVVTAGIGFLLSMLNPVSAIVKAVIMLYKLIMFIIENKDRIIAFLKSLYASINQIVNGAIDPAAKSVEKTLARTIPMVLSLLAKLLNLDGIGKAIRKVLTAIHAKVDKIINPVIKWIAKQARKLLAKGKALVKRGKKKLKALFAWWKHKVTFKARDGSAHKLFFKGTGTSARLFVASKTTLYVDFLANLKVEGDDKKKAHDEAKKISASIDAERIKPVAGTTDTEKESRQKEKAEEIEKLTGALRKQTAIIMGALEQSENPDYKLHTNTFAKRTVAGRLTKVPPKSGAGSTPTMARHAIYDVIDQRRQGEKGASYYIRGHLLNHNLYGKGEWQNMTPLTRKANSDHEKQVESKVKAAIDSGDTIKYTITPSYDGQAGEDRLVKEIEEKDVGEERKTKIKIVKAEKDVPKTMTCVAKSLKPELSSFHIDYPVDNAIGRSYSDYQLGAVAKPDPVALSSASLVDLTSHDRMTETEAQAVIAARKDNVNFVTYKELYTRLNNNAVETKIERLRTENLIKLY